MDINISFILISFF